MKTLQIKDVIAAIKVERRYQDEKWGKLSEQNHRDPERWINTLEEELTEVKDAWFEDDEDNLFMELVQVAAVAVAALQQLGPEDLEERVKRHRMP